MRTAALAPLLVPADPEPVEVINPDSDSPILLVSEHAGQAIPAALENLGISQAILNSHRGWDIGAENVARRLADRLGAPLILQRYSRLVIDSNRPPRGEGSIVETSDGTPIAGNIGISAGERESRIDAVFKPYDRAIEEQFARHPRRAAFSVHSFTPRFEGQARPWHLGLLTRTKPGVAARLMEALQASAPDAVLALNKPYQIDDASDWFIPVHAEACDIPHSLIEIRNDLIDADVGAEKWAGLLGAAISKLMEDQV